MKKLSHFDAELHHKYGRLFLPARLDVEGASCGDEIRVLLQ